MSVTSERSDNRPLIAELIRETIKREKALQERRKRRSRWRWRSTKTTILLGLAHLLIALLLSVFDVATNPVTNTSFGISGALCFTICAIISFIAARRLDRPAQWLIIVFALLSAGMCMALIVDCSLIMHRTCFLERTAKCSGLAIAYHSVLVGIGVIETFICVMSIYASYRNMKDTRQLTTNLLYASLISGDFSRIPHRKPEQMSVSTVECSTITRPTSPHSA